MKDMERQKFENDFKDAFEQAGITPSDNLWTGIELDLEKAESKKMKRTLFMYKLMAAASITFAMFVAGAYYYAGFTNSNRDLAENTIGNNKNTESPRTLTSVTPTQDSKDNNTVVSTSPDKTSTGSDEANENANNISPAVSNETSTYTNRKVEKENAKHVTQTLAANNSVKANTSKNKENYSEANGENRKVDNSNEEERIATLTANNSDGVNSGKDKNTKANNENSKVEKGNDEHTATSTLAANNSDKDNTSRNKENYSNPGSENGKVENGEHVATSALAGNNFDRENSVNNKENYSIRSSDEKLIKHDETDVALANANKIRNANDVNSVLNNDKESDLIKVSLNDKKLPPIIQVKKVELDFPSTPKPDPFAVMMAKLELREKELMEEETPKKKKKTTRTEKLWTSVGFAAGSFNGSSHTTSNGSAVTSAKSLMSSGFNSTTSSRIASNESSASGSSYSMGLNLGTKITNRWIMQGGVNYLMQNSSYQTNVVVSPSDLSSFRAASIAEVKTANSGASSDKVVSTAMYNVNNNSQFVSIPVQAGYLAVNRKVGFQINAGVSTDLFLKNIKDPQGVAIETTTQGRGSDSPYRPLNFSGLFGTELSYKLGQHYRLAINPGLRYPFNSIYKSGVGVTSNPLTMDIGMRFRYIFR
jgi:hypothetical protein